MYIPLNRAGETIDIPYNTASMEEIENTLRDWLKEKIAETQGTGLPLNANLSDPRWRPVPADPTDSAS
jgi:hypothetical protein